MAKKSDDEPVTNDEPRSRLNASLGVVIGVVSGTLIWVTIIGILIWFFR